MYIFQTNISSHMYFHLIGFFLAKSNQKNQDSSGNQTNAFHGERQGMENRKTESPVVKMLGFCYGQDINKVCLTCF